MRGPGNAVVAVAAAEVAVGEVTSLARNQEAGYEWVAGLT